MKRVVGVSIGSSTRDHKVEIELLGEKVSIERRGTDGDLKKAGKIVRELDGQVDAIGLGGMDLYIYAGGRRYTFRDAQKIVRMARKTPVVDGSGLKNSLERWVVKHLQGESDIELGGKRVLMVAAVDRFGMAEALTEAGCRMVFGDFIFALGLPIPLYSLETLARVARVVAPVVTKLPFKMLYPTGDKQESSVRKHAKYFEEAEVIAGDWHYIYRYMPDSLEGKGILTNTVTPENVRLLAERGAAYLVTTTPNMAGRSFGTNVVEAALIALSGKSPEEMSPDDYLRLLQEVGFRPRVERFAS